MTWNRPPNALTLIWSDGKRKGSNHAHECGYHNRQTESRPTQEGRGPRRSTDRGGDDIARAAAGCLTVLGGSGASSIPVLRGVVRSAWFATRSTPQRSDRQSEQISLKHAGWVLFPL